MKIKLFGTTHVANDDHVTKDLSKFAGEVDAFFYEKSSVGTTRSDFKSAILRNPAVFVGVFIYGIMLDIAQYFQNDPKKGPEKLAIENIQSEFGQEAYPVDLNIIRRMGEAHIITSVVSWVVFLVALWFLLAGVIVVLQGGQGGLNALLYGGAIFFFSMGVFVFAVNDERNEAMYSQMIDVCEDKQYDNVCIVTGNGHTSGIKELAVEQGHEVECE